MLSTCKKTNVALLRRIFAQALTNESRELAKKVKIFRNIYYVRRIDQLATWDKQVNESIARLCEAT